MANPWDNDQEVKGPWDNDQEVKGPAIKPKSYMSNLGEYYTKDIPEVAKAFWERTKARANNIGAPATLPAIDQGNIPWVKQQMSTPGSPLYNLQAIPERATRAVLGAGATLADLGLGATSDLAMRAANRWTKGAAGRTAVKALGAYDRATQIPQKLGGQLANTGIGKSLYDLVNPTDPAAQANLKATGYGLETLGMRAPGARQVTEGVIQAGTAVPKATLGLSARIIEKPASWLSEEITGVPAEVLKKYGWGPKFSEGARNIRAAAGTEAELGNMLVNKIHNMDQYLPERAVIEQAIPNMPPVPVMRVIETLEGAKKPGLLKESKAINDKIEEKIKEIREISGKSGVIPAQQVLDLRKELDAVVDDAFGQESGAYITALKKARHTLAEDLVTSAKASGNPEYATAMSSMADKLQKIDKLKRWLGKSTDVQTDRSQQFISTLFGKNKEARQKVVKDLSDIFGEDIFGEAKNAYMAGQLGPKGIPTILPRQTTGRALMGPALAGGVAGPVAAALGLPAASATSGLLIPLAALSSPKTAAPTLSTIKSLADWTRRK